MAACASSGRQGPRSTGAVRLTQLVQQRQAALYDQRRPARLAPLQRQLLARIAAAAVEAGRRAPSTDQQATAAAATICRGLPARGAPPAALVEFALRAHGLIDPPPHLIVAQAGAGDGRQLADQLAPRFATVLATRGYGRVGIGLCRGPTARRLVVALFESIVRLAPIKRVLALGETAKLVATVVASHSRAVRLALADPAGAVTITPLLPTGEGRYRRRLRCEKRGVYRVELMGRGSFGNEVLANFPVYCGRRPPTTVRYRLQPAALGTPRQLERRLVELTNAFRSRAGLPALKVNPALREVARQHSRDMSRVGFVGHVSPTSGGPPERVRRAAIPYLVVRENVARAYSAEEAFTELVHSPAHLANVLSTDVSEIGVGVVVARRGSVDVLFVTQNFLRPAMPFDRNTAVRDVLRLVSRARREAGRSPLTVSDTLARLAQRYLDDYRRRGRGLADASLARALRGVGGFRRVSGVLLKVSALDGARQARDLLRRGPTHIGVAVRGKAGQIAIFALLGTAP